MSDGQYIRATDLETIKSILEFADIDFEEYEEKELIIIETTTYVVFKFNEDETLIEVYSG